MAVNFEDAFFKNYMDTMYPMEPDTEPQQDMQLASANTGVTTDVGGIAPIPRNKAQEALGYVGQLLTKAGVNLDEYGLDIPVLGRVTLKDLTVGESGRILEDMSYGFMPTGKSKVEDRNIVEGPGGERRVAGLSGSAPMLQPEVMDLLGLPLVGTAAKVAAKPVMKATGNLIEAGKDLPVGMSIQAVDGIPTGQPRQSVVSTRLPTAVKATENPLESNLIIDFDAVKKDPEAFKHNMGLIQQYPNFASKAKNPERRAEDFITEVKDNLLFLHDNVPDATRQRSKLWYDGARNIVDKWTNQYNVPDDAISGVLAVLSPQKDWFMNVSLGERVLDIMSTKRGIKWDPSMDEVGKVIWAKPQYAEMVNAIRGKSLDELQDDGLKAMWLRTYDQAKNPREHQIVSPEGDFVGVRLTDKGQPYKTGWGSLSEIGKAIKIFENPTVESISNNLGSQHKVRNFYNNIYDPTNPAGYVTIDTHAVAAGLLRPLSGNSREVSHNFGSNVLGEVGPKNSSVTGVQGTYGLYAEAYRRAAQERGVLPREMQSITWEAVRGLFPDTFKNAKNNELVDSIWLKYRKGQISQEEARNEVLKSAGGINAPEWERTGRSTGSAQEVQRTTNKGELSGVSVPRGDAKELGSGKRTRATKGTATGVTSNNNLPAEGM